MASARPSTEERFSDATWRTFDGRALAVLRPVEPGSVTVTVSAPGLEGVRIELEVVAAG